MEEQIDETNQQENPPNQQPHTLSNNDKHPFFVLGLLLVTIMAGGLLSAIISALVGNIFDVDLQTSIKWFGPTATLQERYAVRSVAIINQLFTFLLPSLVVSWILYRHRWKDFLKLTSLPQTKILLGAIIFILVAFPLAQGTYWLNRQIPLPEVLTDLEQSTAQLIKGILIMDSPLEFVFNLIVIALVPALAEEFVFRGILQQKLQKLFNNPIVGLWAAAFIFSFIHFQFEGFLPRMILGALLGYLFYWSGNLWVPVVAHFCNNGFQVVAAYLAPETLEKMDMENVQQMPWALTFISLVLTFSIGMYLYAKTRKISDKPKV